MQLRDALITVTVCCVTVLSVFVSGATTVSITTIGKDLAFKQSELQWPLNVFSLSYGCLLLLCGRLADIIGNKKMFILGSLWFSIWSIAAAFAPNSTTFIVFLGLQGIGAAANSPAGIAIVSSHFPKGQAKNQAFAAIGAGQPIGFIGGLILGGLLSQSSASWRCIFYLQAGLGFLLVILGWFILPEGDSSRRYDKGLDWVGAVLSTAGIGLLVYDLAQSTTTPHGWATPFVPSLFGTSILLIISFVLWEIRREARGQSVLVPMSMWYQPGAKMGPIISLVFFGWWAFNTLSYFVTVYLEQVKQLTPLKTALQLIPLGLSGLLTNIVTGYIIGFVPSQILVLLGLGSCIISCILFSLINVHASYWAMTFIIMLTLPVLDIAYTVANIQVCSSFQRNSQALAGSIFSVATRLGTSLGLAVTSSIAQSVTEKYVKNHPDLSPTDPLALLSGYRAAGWTCVGAAGISLLIAILGLRGIGFVGQNGAVDAEDKRASDLELAAVDAAGESPEEPPREHTVSAQSSMSPILPQRSPVVLVEKGGAFKV